MKKIVLFAAILRIILVTAIISFTIIVSAQSVAVNTTGTQADASAMLDIASTSKGFLAPRMTTTQRTGIVSPANGLMVFDTDTKSYWYYANAWKEVGIAGGGSFSLPYSGSFSDPGKIFFLNNPDSSNGATAIYGRSGSSGIGITPGISMGVWGDNSRGVGVLGTSDRGVGTYGVSFQNHGVSGYTTSNAFAGVYGSHDGSGSGVWGASNTGFGIKGVSSTNHGVYGSTNGFASAGVYGTNSGNGGVGVKGEISNNGIAIYGDNNGGDGNAARFTVSNSSNTNDVVQISTVGPGRALYAYINNSSNSNVAADIETNGLGRALFVDNSNANNLNAAIYANSNGVKGIEGVANGTGVYGRSSKPNNGIGVQGQTMQNDINGIGVRGISYSTNLTSGAVTGINYSNGVAVYGESTAGGVAVYGKTTRQNGAAVYGINDAPNGHAIQGSATGTDGVAIYGEAGNSSSNSYAGYFRNSNASNSRNVVQIDNLGTGNFLSLTNGLGDVKATIAKNGNITTDGTVTVKGDKGIVRSSTSAQLRTEVVPASFVTPTHVVLDPLGYVFVNVTFNNPFSAAPAVFLGNITNDGGNSTRFHISILNVTSTGCQLKIMNTTNIDEWLYSSTWNLIAIGPE